ncbi:LysR family transcriptional regulator [Sphingomonas sp. HF-S4]|uniref:LysR family transcriptional regulator n=1 Tax=Sphingomonas agrestis TaxID=3080540 RepID=A0ABU3YAC4_9SPHN|nr:LysR family transcriptional regulator [Sphingomonas sp. HF-S4]MDV3458344.1 LysR family transcriptional regulator [Sphingomonas sp. HF-S4]
MAQPDARTLEIFRAVAATGSATRAAQRLNTTQPNVTRAIGMFEKACGFALFDRGRYGMALTPAGEQLLDVVNRNWAGLRSIGKVIAEMRTGPPGTLRAITVPFLAECELPALLGDYLRERPRVAVAIKMATHDFVYFDIETGGSDVGVIVGPPMMGTGLHILPIGESRLALAVPAGHRLAGHALVDFADLHGECFIQLTRPNHIRVTTDAMLARCGAKPALVHEVSTQRTLVELVRHGIGIGLADIGMIHNCAGGVVPVAIDPAAAWPIHLIYNGSRTHSTMLDSFLAWFAERTPGPG